MTDPRPTNDQIADLILTQTYEERVDISEYLADCAKSWVEGGGELADLDYSYFASLLAGWAEQQRDARS
ncbi:hypothetical protein [Devosia sp. 2618]|uniref:hypothetical protein n=1 Tax=Devosia sp. 2618 TaxID=3156454 RepID=UPI0033931475